MAKSSARPSNTGREKRRDVFPDKKFTSGCTCSSPYRWSNSSENCVCAGVSSCTGTYETGGIGSKCNGLYAKCACKEGFYWSEGCGICQEDGAPVCV